MGANHGWTILKTTHWLCDTIHVKQDDLIFTPKNPPSYAWIHLLAMQGTHSENKSMNSTHIS